MRVVLYDFTPMNDVLSARYLNNATWLKERDIFSVYRIDANILRTDLERPQNNADLTLPASFGDAQLLGYEASSQRIAPGGALALITRWSVTGQGTPQPVAIFAHLVDANGKIVAQSDRLGYPHHGWRPGDLFVQLHRITVPLETTPGKYQLRLGIYYGDTGARWPVAGGDFVSLGQVEVVSGQ
jgi:hypothetical protein